MWNGADDIGQQMADSWFSNGVGFAIEALADPDAQVLVHCHMGINRGPSMAFAVLLALGMTPVAALSAIRRGRPVAAIAYAEDALDWWHRTTRVSPSVVKRQRGEVERWHERNPLDFSKIIRMMRVNEGTIR